MTEQSAPPIRRLLEERLESPAQQQSHEIFLIPRNCWFQITKLMINPKKVEFEKNQKIRIQVNVPNSGRVMKTSQIQIDESLIQYLSSTTSEFAEIPVDITAVCEYRHDARYAHSSIIEFELELTSSILYRTKIIGSASFDMANVLQKPFNGLIPLLKDSNTIASLKIQIHSLCLSHAIPLITASSSAALLSDSDSELPSSAPQNTLNFAQAFSTAKIILVDSKVANGQILIKTLSGNDSVLPISEASQIQALFEAASQFFTELPSNPPARFIIAGDDNFVCRVLTPFLFMRDRGIFPTNAFAFIIVPLSTEKSFFAQCFGAQSMGYANQFLKPQWLNIFLEDSAVQNSSSMVISQIEALTKADLKPYKILISDVLITTTDSQFVVPMLHELEIGDPTKFTQATKSTSNLVQFKATFIGAKNKTMIMKFHHLLCTSSQESVVTRWREITNSNIIPMIQSFDKYGIEEHKRTSGKVILVTHKGQGPLNVRIDETVHQHVTGLTVTIREADAAIIVCIPQ